MTGDLESRLRAAVRAEAATADGATSMADEDASLGAIRSRVRTVRRRRRAMALAAATVAVVLAVGALPRLGGDRADVNVVGGPADREMTTSPDDSTPGTTPSTTGADAPSATGEDTGTTTSPPPDPDIIGDGFQPLWPFATRAAATTWQEAYDTGGQQPWHLDAEQTALSFTTGFLGFTEIDQITSSDIGPDEAEVGVGYTNPDGGMSTAALIHLMRYGTGDDAPWEVVGTHDTDLLLETPDYGTTARSPMTVAGYVTGVDESLRVQVRQSSSAESLGESCCLPAGGTEAPWETTVEFSGASDPAITVIASTGGHVQEVERFAITGLRS